jgi:hypothetical protein
MVNDPVPKTSCGNSLEWAVLSESDQHIEQVWAYTLDRGSAELIAIRMEAHRMEAQRTKTAEEKAAAKPDPSIMMAGPMVHEPGCYPYRIVLRQERGQYIVHAQIFPHEGEGKPYFYCGDYYPFTGGQEVALGKALDRFADRVKRRMRFLLPAEAATRLDD